MEYLVLALVIVIAAGGWTLLRSRQGTVPVAAQALSYDELSAGEKKIGALIREVYGDSILEQEYVRDGDAAKVLLHFDAEKSKLQNLTVSLSSLQKAGRRWPD